MTTIGEFEFPDELYYDVDHVWARLGGSVVTVGISQMGQHLAGDIVYVEVPSIGRVVAKNEPFMSMESGKWVGRVKSPVGGKIVEANDEIEWESGLVNEDPYGEGWLAKVEVSDQGDLDSLMRADTPEFAAYIAAEREKYGK